MYRALLWFRKPSNTLWLMPTIGGVFAVIFALAASFSRWFLPPNIFPNIGESTLHDLLDAISGSMLAVSTFSLSIMVSAFAAAASGATPRATELVMADDNTQITIASFISAFIYAIIAKIVLGLEYYGQNGRFILFISTVLVLGYVIVILIRWVGTLSQLGRLGNTIDKITTATLKAYRIWLGAPDFAITGSKPEQRPSLTVHASESGYLTHFNVNHLDTLAEKYHGHIHILRRPGHMLFIGDPLCEFYGQYDSSDDDNLPEAMRSAFIIQADRTYENDPRHGLIVLSETAQRALSPAVNDPGTAIKILHTLGIILTDVSATKDEDEHCFQRLSIISANYQDFIRQPFDPIARDGAGTFEIAIRMQKTLAAIARNTPKLAKACEKQAQRAIKYTGALPLEEDREVIQRLHERLFPPEKSEK